MLQQTPVVSEGDFCETTKRVILVSPQPASMQAIVAELSTRCYDVLMFHHEHDPAIRLLPADVIIVDRTRSQSNEKIQLATTGAQLVLIADERQRYAGTESLLWPQQADNVIDTIERLANQRMSAGAITPSSLDVLILKDIVIDVKRMTVLRAGQAIALTKTEFDLLRLIVASDGQVLSRQKIMDELYGEGYFGGSNSVDVHVKTLRQKLSDDPKQPKYIVTMRGVGYKCAE